MICSKCGAEIKSKAELAGLEAKGKVALYLSQAYGGTYPAETSRATGVSHPMAQFYLNLLAIEQEGYKADIGEFLHPVYIYYPYDLVEGMANYPEWSVPSAAHGAVSTFKCSIVRKQGNPELLCRIQQHLIINGIDQGVSGIVIPRSGIADFESLLLRAMQEDFK